MKTIEIKNKILYLDDEDYELVKNNKLYLLNSRGRLFARALINGVQHTVHRLILGYPKNRIAFKDKNTLNLQKDNLQLINATCPIIVRQAIQDRTNKLLTSVD